MSGPPDLERALGDAPAVRVAREALGRETPAWIVGGAVRDALLGESVRDIDLAVEPGSEEPAARGIARAAGGFVFPLSEEHAVWRAVAHGGEWHADLIALRADTIEADLGLRDFTVNAIAVPLAGGDPINPTGGLADAEARLLRAVSERSFAEDPLRLLRAARLAARHGLELDGETIALARASSSRAAEPAGERQFAELRGILAGPDPLRGLALMDELGATAAVLPELSRLQGVIQNPNHHLDVYGHTLAVLEHVLAVERDLPLYAGGEARRVRELLDEPLADELTRGGALRFGALLHDVGKPETRAERAGYVTFIGHDRVGARIADDICRRLRASRRLSAHLQGLALHHLRLGFLVSERPLPPRLVYEYLRATEPVAADVTLLSVADRLSARGGGALAGPEMIEAHLELAREMLPPALDWHRDGPPRPPVGGNRLAAEAGIRPGPEMGRILEELRAQTFCGEISGPEQALARARELAAG
jgi:putative nucleotidyltransferase with HDIG domain